MAQRYPRELLATLIEESKQTIVPSARETLEALADTVFFASLMREEGEPVRLAIVHDEGGASALKSVTDTNSDGWGEEGPPEAWSVTLIRQRDFSSRELAKLSKGLRYGQHLIVVGGRSPKLWIDGIARRIPRTDGGAVTRLSAPRPGVLVYEEGAMGLFRLEDGVRTRATDIFLYDGPLRRAIAKIAAVAAGDANYQTRSGPEVTLELLLREMRNTSAGGILAVLPSAPDDHMLARVGYLFQDQEWLSRRMSKVASDYHAWMLHVLASAGSDLSVTELKKREACVAACEQSDADLFAAIEQLGTLSAIDGALLFGPKMAFYGAGCMLPAGSGKLLPLFHANDAEGKITEPYARRFGARHTAALHFVGDNPGAVAFVVSEDGPVTAALRTDDKITVWSVRIPET